MEPDMILDVPERIISVSTTMFSRTKKIVIAASKIICVLGKTVSLTHLILDAAQMTGSNWLKIAHEPEMIGFVKGKGLDRIGLRYAGPFGRPRTRRFEAGRCCGLRRAMFPYRWLSSGKMK